MYPFKHHMPVNVEVGMGILNDSKRYKLPYRHVLLVVKPTLNSALSKTLETVMAQLKQQNINVRVFSDVSHPLDRKNVLDLIKIAKTEDVDAVMAFGGGKTMDLAKLVARFKLEDITLFDAWLNSYTEPPFEYDPLPTIMMPITFNLASAVSNKAFIHQKNKQQYFRFKSNTLFPAHLWLDVACFETADEQQSFIEAYLNMLLRGVELLLNEPLSIHETTLIDVAMRYLINDGVYLTDETRPRVHLERVLYAFLVISSLYLPKTRLPLHQISDAVEGYHESMPYSAYLSRSVLPYLAIRLAQSHDLSKLKALFEHTPYHNNNLYVAFENLLYHLKQPKTSMKQHGVELALVSDYIIHLKALFPSFEALSDDEIYTVIEQTLLS